MAKQNRKFKDSVFTDLFGNDIDAKKNFLSLYNALHNTDLKISETKIEHTVIPQSIYKTFNNDVSMIVNNRLIVMIEHQSTINENMPLRFLEYVTRIYEGIIKTESRYLEKKILIPTPEFYVFYNGVKDYPDEKILHLSDSFFYEDSTERNCQLELDVKVLNIGPGKELPIIYNCDILKQYCDFIDLVRRETIPNDEESYKRAVDNAINQNILRDYLLRNSIEVINMLIAEYDYDTDIRVKCMEAKEELLKEKILAKLNKGKTVEQIADELEESIDTITNLKKLLQTSN